MIAKGFLLTSVLYGLFGIALGLHMAIGGDHGQMPTHAHLMVLSWLSFFGFGLYYQLFPAVTGARAAKVHFWLAQLSAPVLFVGLLGLYGGYPEMDPVAAIGSIVYAVSFLSFAIVVFSTVGKRSGG